MRLVIFVLFVTATARAEGRLDAHFGGGLEGGTITHKARPDGVGEVGLTAEWLVPDRNYGIGFAFETVARPDHDLSTYEEDKFDLMVRLSRPDRKFHAGVGGGVRLMQPEPIDGVRQPMNLGIDWIRIDLSGPFAKTHVAGAAVSIDGYISWTLGCYLDRTTTMVEQPQNPRDVSCADTFTTTYTLGLAFALAGR